ncbi:hypothetical protein [Yoonia sp. BS5-3]|uniref:Branched-chain amino acid transport system / permease component n=1 Tax=Yoonia phaeophyticola TaxID=3137369 RepID=A0ABZ2V8U9_9RHOB
MLVIAISVVGGVLGACLPLRWGLIGFLSSVFLLFALQAGINVAGGFAGASIEESLLLFNGSYLSYLGFNLQITYRAFTGPILALTIPFIFRLFRRD